MITSSSGGECDQQSKGKETTQTDDVRTGPHHDVTVSVAGNDDNEVNTGK